MRARRLVPLVVLGLALAGCGEAETRPTGSASVPVVTRSPLPLDPSTSGPTPSPTPEPGEPTQLGAAPDDPWTPWSKGGPPPTDLSDVESPGFTSPSGNLGCTFDFLEPGHGNATVTCQRRQGLGVDEPRPASCDEGAWGDTVVGSAEGRGELGCETATVFGQAGETDGTRVLPYGAAVRFRGLTCASRAEGVQCLNAERRGFVIDRIAIVTR